MTFTDFVLIMIVYIVYDEYNLRRNEMNKFSLLFTNCKVGGVTIEQVFRRLIPFFIVTAVILLLVTFIPALSLTLPQMLDLIK